MEQLLRPLYALVVTSVFVSAVACAQTRLSEEARLDAGSSQSVNDSIPASAPEYTLEGITVRSTRIVTPLGGEPYAALVLMNDRATAGSPPTVSDALGRLAGVSTVRDGMWSTDISIRGMSRSNIVSLLDYTRLEAANDIAGKLSLMDPADLERVEVVKSSGSVLYGSGALGGVVNFISKRARVTDHVQHALEFRSSATSGNRGLGQHVAWEHSSEWFGARLSGGYRTAGNTMTPAGELSNSQFNDFSVNGSARLKTVGDQSMLLLYQRSQSENTGIPGSSAISASADARFTLSRRELTGIEYSIPNMITSIPLTTLRAYRQEIVRNVEIVQNPTLTLRPRATHTTYGGQIESMTLPRANHVLTVGVEFWQRSLDSRRERIDKSKGILIGEQPIPTSSYMSASLYAQDEWILSKNHTSMVLGARHDWIRVNNDLAWNPEYTVSLETGIRSADNRALLWNSRHAHDESWSAMAGVHHSLTSSAGISFLATTAFRSPSLEERYQFIDLGSSVRIGNPNLQPERSLALNVSATIRGRDVNVRGDVFLNTLRDLVTEVPGEYEGRPALVKVNIGEARLTGFELTSEYRLSGAFTINTSVAYVRGVDRRTGEHLPRIAPLRGELEFVLSSEDLGSAHFLFSGSRAQNALAPGEQRTAGYGVVDAGVMSAPVRLGDVVCSVRAGVENVFNHAYQDHLSTLRGIVKLEPGRNFYLTLSVGF
jgi:hemoglobin/transferrin/lactoferrin receptor protein